MPPKHPFRASLSDVAQKKLNRIVAYEEEKAGVDANGEQIRLSPRYIIEGLIDVRHELIASGITNRQRLGGVVEAVEAMMAMMEAQNKDIARLRELLELIIAAEDLDDVRPSE